MKLDTWLQNYAFSGAQLAFRKLIYISGPMIMKIWKLGMKKNGSNAKICPSKIDGTMTT